MVGTIRKAKAARSRFLLGVLVTIFILYSLSGILFVISNRYNVIVGEGKKLHINEFFNIWNAEKQSSYNPSMSTREIAYIGSKEFMADVLNRLVDSKLIELEVENFAVRKPDELVLKVISEEKSFHSNGSFDFAKFENFLKQGGLTELDLVEKVRDNENKKFLMDALSSVPLVNETEIEVLQEENNLNRDVKIFSIEQSKLKKGAKEVSEDDVRQYYYRNVQKFTAPETRKIDYIKLTNYRPSQLRKLQEIVTPRANIREISKTMKVNVESFGYLSENDILDKKEYSNMVGIFSIRLNGLSNVMRIGNDAYVYSVTDIKNGYVKELKEVENEIISILRAERTLELRKKIVLGYLEEYRDKKFADEVLVNRGFTVKRIRHLNRKSDFSFGKDSLKQIMTIGNGETTEIFHDNGNIYFALVLDSKILRETDENHVGGAKLLEELVGQISETILEHYLKYLRNRKYIGMKVNYGLLDLIM